ncbi:MAG TPA: hypothetical protein VK013_06710 [Myxococcaceae bacterium]|nr:hypothetical protein [Myxococcaceae bacterium]
MTDSRLYIPVRALAGAGAALLLSLTGCASTPRVDPAATVEAADDAHLTPHSHYYPLEVGNRWSYRIVGSSGGLQTVELVGRQQDAFVDQQGGQLTVDEEGIHDGARYLLKAPVRSGTRWSNVISATATEHYRIISALAPCEVPAGRFDDCAVVEARQRVDDGVTLSNTMTFARGVGLVRVQVTAHTARGEIPQSELQLEDYDVQVKLGPSGD